MLHTTMFLAAMAALSPVAVQAKQCSFNQSEPFTLHAEFNKAMVPLYLLSEVANPDKPGNNDFYGLSTVYRDNTDQSIFEINGGNLMAVKTQYPKHEPFQSNFVFNDSQLNLSPQYQNPPESSGLSLVAASGGACYLDFNKTVNDWYLCKNSEGDNTIPFVGYVAGAGPLPQCNRTLIVAMPSQ